MLKNLTETPEEIEFSDNWTEQDIHDLSAFALSHGEELFEKN